ncbi:M23 family metallopeptidase [Cryobacterium sp. PAMC25264]|uniref:M23 family metallopeptidase n=1 Tax=Cryobacterium sp. PAMC25264 TaxID=2861288 RepID=UPI001C629811|nr:M23 family metallopeptidase [Cryobacterium sp. PAMC25264]QYF75134.1 M23 family metallopeptidase [Cryobacterium sp. PAMC25264]
MTSSSHPRFSGDPRRGRRGFERLPRRDRPRLGSLPHHAPNRFWSLTRRVLLVAATTLALIVGGPAPGSPAARAERPTPGPGSPSASSSVAPADAVRPPAPGARSAPSSVAAPDAVPLPEPAGAPAAAPAATPLVVWTWPVGPPRDQLRPFEAPSSRFAAGHRGIDLVALAGSPVRAPADGVVSFAGTVVDRPVLSIQHGEDLISSFEPVSATVATGERVRAGQVVGIVASGAHCSDRCVHFGVRRHGQYISPVLFLGGIARAILLPLPPTGPIPHPPR